MDPQDAPDVRQLWHRTHTARKRGRLCDFCHDPVEPGQRYEDWASLIDGKFERLFIHEHAYRYPSGCPKQRMRDLAEEEAQFARDAALWDAQTAPSAEQGDAS